MTPAYPLTVLVPLAEQTTEALPTLRVSLVELPEPLQVCLKQKLVVEPADLVLRVPVKHLEFWPLPKD